MVWLSVACAAVVVSMSAARPVAAEEIRSVFGPGELIVTADDGFTIATIQKLTYAYPWCETDPLEVSCAWNLKAVLLSNPSRRCAPDTPDEALIWESGPQTGPATVESGVRSFPLEGCRGQTLMITVEYERTRESGGGGGMGQVSSGSENLAFVVFGFRPFEEIEEAIVRANPPTRAATPLATPAAPPILLFARSCRSFSVDGERYAFAFKQLGCRTAQNLARRFFASRGAPRGYRCLRKPSSRIRCWRKGRAKKFVEWRPPRTGRQGTA